MALSRLFVCRQRVLIGHWPDWPSIPKVLTALSGRSAAGPGRLVPDILMAAGAYRIGCTDLLYMKI